MANRSAEIISKEINEKIVLRNDLMNKAKALVIKELEKYDTFSFEFMEADQTILIKGNMYGQAVLDLNHWFGLVRESDPADNLAREMMEDIKNQLLPERDYSM